MFLEFYIVGVPSIKNTPNLTFEDPRVPVGPSGCDTTPLHPKPPEKIDLAETCFFRGPGLTPKAPGSRSPAQKLLARSYVGPENLTAI